MEMNEMVGKFFRKSKYNSSKYEIVGMEAFRLTWSVNKKCLFLHALITTWINEVQIFCYPRQYPEMKIELKEKTVFSYKNPTFSCDYCKWTQEILRAIFGSPEEFNQLFFVRKSNRDGREYVFTFDQLLLFGQGKEDELREAIRIEDEECEKRRKQQEAAMQVEREKQKKEKIRKEKINSKIRTELDELMEMKKVLDEYIKGLERSMV